MMECQARDTDSLSTGELRCDICGNLDVSRPLEYGRSLDSILQQASNGCGKCSLLGSAVKRLGDETTGLEEVKVGWDTNRIQGLRIIVGAISDSRFLQGIDMFTRSGNRASWYQIPHAEKPANISGHTGSETAEASLRGWMHNCDQTHSCRSPTEASLPTRLLDIRSYKSVSLYCSEKNEKGTYACLSHCWGRTPTFCTTSANFTQHRESIAWESLPQVYQHAILTAFKLKIPFIWIDSLCIIQDVEEDWRAESAGMAEIYAHSVLTIAASLAHQDSDSLFVESSKQHCSTLLQTVDGSEILVRKTMDHGHGPAPLPLLNRAWVLQERLLSPRVVHFTDQELVWECMEYLTCECGCIRSLWSPGHTPFDKNLLYEPILARASRQDLKARWRLLVQEYSRLQLTLSRDKLPAISGAARRFSKYFRGKYLAGLWEDGLVSDLLWEARHSGGMQRVIPALPSWSWMRPGTQIMYDDCMKTNELASVVSARCKYLRESDPFGEVDGGEVCIMATMMPLSTFGDIQSPTSKLTQEPTGLTTVYLEHNTVVIFDHGRAVTSSSLQCARMAIRYNVYQNNRDEEVWLVLAPVSSQPGVYMRVGILKLPGEAGNKIWDTVNHREPKEFSIV